VAASKAHKKPAPTKAATHRTPAPTQVAERAGRPPTLSEWLANSKSEEPIH
jgi:hypothetical protein